MASAFLAKTSTIDAATVTTSDADALFPISNALTDQPRTVCRASGTSMTIDVDLGRLQATLTPAAAASPSAILNSNPLDATAWGLYGLPTRYDGPVIGGLFQSDIVMSNGSSWVGIQDAPGFATVGTTAYIDVYVAIGSSNAVRIEFNDIDTSPRQYAYFGIANPGAGDAGITVLDSSQVAVKSYEYLIDAALQLYRYRFVINGEIGPITNGRIRIETYSSVVGESVIALGATAAETPDVLIEWTTTPPINVVGMLYHNAPRDVLYRVRGAHSVAAFTAVDASDRWNNADADVDFTLVGWYEAANTVKNFFRGGRHKTTRDVDQ